MGKLVEGVWHDVWYNTEKSDGAFKRKQSAFRHWVVAPGQNAPTGQAFPAESGRYHLFVSYACPWAHRALIFRALKGLEQMVGLSVVHPLMLKNGWSFDDHEGVIPDPILGARYLHQVYTAADSRYTGRVTVPVLWDKQSGTIISNESSEIIRMFNSAFDGLGAKPGDYYPTELREEIDAINERIYSTVNNGVYKCGFATSQGAYEQAFSALFESLDWLEQRLSSQRYLLGQKLTEADWRLFTTLLRFDPVYHGHFKTNLQRLVDYPNLWAYTRDLYQTSGVRETVRMDHIKLHYYGSHESINPSGVVPLGPRLDLEEPHGRQALG